MRNENLAHISGHDEKKSRAVVKVMKSFERMIKDHD